MVFNIGSQQGGVVNNVAGNQTVHGGQSGHLTADGRDVRDLVGELRTAVEQAPLPPAVAPGVHSELDALDTEVARPEPDREEVASRLTRVTRMLTSAGALVTASAGLIGPITALAGWLGALGRPILQAIGG
ncbi:hypothetical protein GCM10009639_11490 [Kitasatospora putterlickiae]|uniref:Uncharacterized protein n=1 Tax=Kitasatospora putterlickiae TaxID=221725 RepID=A0ABN1XPK1_9ACTN